MAWFTYPSSTRACTVRSPVPSPASATPVAVRPGLRIRAPSSSSDVVDPPYPGTSSTAPGRPGTASGGPPDTDTPVTMAATATATASAPNRTLRRGLRPVHQRTGVCIYPMMRPVTRRASRALQNAVARPLEDTLFELPRPDSAQEGCGYVTAPSVAREGRRPAPPPPRHGSAVGGAASRGRLSLMLLSISATR